MSAILETNRLLLKQFSIEDAEHLFELNSDPEVVKYTGDSVYTDIEQASQSFIRNKEQYEKYNQGRLSVFIKETGEYIGWCGLRYFPDSGQSDLGYRLMKKYWGNGYATEAAAACLDYGFKTLGLQEIIGTAMEENTASVNIFKKLGLKYSHDTNDHAQPCVVYTITKEEWNAPPKPSPGGRA